MKRTGAFDVSSSPSFLSSLSLFSLQPHSSLPTRPPDHYEASECSLHSHKVQTTLQTGTVRLPIIHLSNSLALFTDPHPSNDIDQPSYRPGRFHAHALPTNSTSRVGGGGGEELVPSGGGRERLREAVKLGEGAKRFFRRKKGKGKEKRFDTDEGERERLLSEEEESEFQARLRVQVPVVPRRRLVENVIREEEGEDDEEEDDAGEISWLLLRPGKKRVRRWMASWWKRWALLVGLPCVIVSPSFPFSSNRMEDADEEGR